jgi:hypothetical protein
MKDFDSGTLPVTFTCRQPLKRDILTVATIEGISQADVVRRAVLRDIRRMKEEWLREQGDQR